MTPARLEANRRNAKKSTGPRTARGKSQSRMNSLRTGNRSAINSNLYFSLMMSPPGMMGSIAESILASGAAAHPFLASTLEICRQAEAETGAMCTYRPPWAAPRRKNPY